MAAETICEGAVSAKGPFNNVPEDHHVRGSLLHLHLLRCPGNLWEEMQKVGRESSWVKGSPIQLLPGRLQRVDLTLDKLEKAQRGQELLSAQP